MSDMDFICPTCKRPTHPTDNEIIEYLVKEKDRYRDILGERTKELERTRKALEIAVDKLKGIKAYYDDSYDTPHFVNWHIVAQRLANDADDTIKTITAPEQKESAFVHNKIEFPEYNDSLLEEFDKQFFENGQDDDLTETALEQKE